MKLCNLQSERGVHLGLVTERGIVDATAAGCTLCMDDVIKGADRTELMNIEKDTSLALVENPVYANIVDNSSKIVCVGLNYNAYIDCMHAATPDYPVLFSKFSDTLAPCGAVIDLPAWETSYDYEAELVIVIGKDTWNVSEANAKEHIFGYSVGNDMTCREAQTRSGQWLIGKTMPGFAPCGPCIVTADCLDPDKGCAIKSYVNGELRQNDSTADMIFDCAQIVSYASRYIHFKAGDIIYTGTPRGVALELTQTGRHWLTYGDRVDVEIEGIGVLTNTMS